MIAQSLLKRFLTAGLQVKVRSSNITAASYDPRGQVLYLKFKDSKSKPGGSYAYRPISPAEATSFFVASSQGIWFWDNIRVRGTSKGHKKEWRKIG